MKKDYLIAINNDLFDIADRLKSVNPCYKVFYNVAKSRYEVHSDGKHAEENTLAFVVPYESLDARTIEYAQKTSVANVSKLVKKMEENNRRAEQRALKDAVDEAMAQVESCLVRGD